ncbi:ORF24 [Ranid herpesvirus 2]|uniref:ORF24 n=1 Tax=Ranid herpesvirus 2 TaxID=389214 RepID=Q14W82_9VIRU|nr:ORF24 [Ranid herpesvirus 2]ABG25683.1 ORF24 [Ranid herpesvirus 2]
MANTQRDDLWRVYPEFQTVIKFDFEKHRDWSDFMRAVVLHEFSAGRLKLGEFNLLYQQYAGARRKAGLEATAKTAFLAFKEYVYTKYTTRGVCVLNEFLKHGVQAYRRYLGEFTVLRCHVFENTVKYRYHNPSYLNGTVSICYADKIPNRLPAEMQYEIEAWRGARKTRDSFDFGLDDGPSVELLGI